MVKTTFILILNHILNSFDIVNKASSYSRILDTEYWHSLSWELESMVIWVVQQNKTSSFRWLLLKIFS